MKPAGRQAVREAVLEAAVRLFAERGPKATSIRHLARAAGVNHGLIHRHFGSKQELLTLVMDHLVRRFDRAMGPATDHETVGDILPKVFSVARIQRSDPGVSWSWTILEGHDPADIQGGFPVVQRLLDAARRSGVTDPEALVARSVALGLGLVVFEPFLRASLNLEPARWRAIQRSLL